MRALRWLWARPWFRYGAAPALVLLLVTVESSNKARSAIRHALRDPYALLNGRSPGDRDAGALFQTKLAYSRAQPAGARPHQRVLPMERVRPPLGGGSVPGLGASPLGIPASTLGPLGDSLPNFGGGGPPSLIGNTAPPFIGGGAVPTDAAAPTPAPNIPAAAVPEPETWGLLLIGVGVIGFAFRRRRRAARRGTGDTGSEVAPIVD